ncbi:MAG: hypothetical protein AAF630_05210 [Cyanobacteria bacterium P01_C01_bin.38]
MPHAPCPMPHALCPMPYAPCPIPIFNKVDKLLALALEVACRLC